MVLGGGGESKIVCSIARYHWYIKGRELGGNHAFLTEQLLPNDQN